MRRITIARQGRVATTVTIMDATARLWSRAFASGASVGLAFVKAQIVSAWRGRELHVRALSTTETALTAHLEDAG